MSRVQRPTAAADPYVEADIREAARALLRRPLLTRERNPDALALVRRHQAALTSLFADGLGYRLVVEPTHARLAKTALAADSSQPLLRRNGTAFTPRGYALLALTLAALNRSRRQLMVDELVAEVRAAAADAGVDVDLDAIHDRRALHAGLLALVDLGVLRERDGDLEHWVDARTASLLDIDRDRLALLVVAPLARCDSPAQVHEAIARSIPSSAGGARIAVRRMLTEQPILTADDLTDEQLGWWRRNREREREWFRSRLGLELELRTEGALALDPDNDLTDLDFPGAGSAKHFALLLLGALVERARTGDVSRSESSTESPGAWARLPASSAQSCADEVFRTWRHGLKKGHQESVDMVYGEAVAILAATGLVRVEPGAVLVHAAAARYSPRPEWATDTGPAGELSLFEEFG